MTFKTPEEAREFSEKCSKLTIEKLNEKPKMTFHEALRAGYVGVAGYITVYGQHAIKTGKWDGKIK